MNSSHEDSSSDESETFMDTNDNQDKKNHPHHSNHQIQKLESYFIDCQRPDKSQRRRLGEELMLKPKQIKFWFQNKRTQTRIYNEKLENAALRAENKKIKCENEAMEDALMTVVCPPCGGRPFGKEAQLLHLQDLRAKNASLKVEVEKLSKYIAHHRARSIPSVDGLLKDLHDPSTYGSTSNSRLVSHGTSSNHVPEKSSLENEPHAPENTNITLPPKRRKSQLLHHFQQLSPLENLKMIATAAKALAEVTSLIRMEESIWTKSSIDGRLVIDPENYDKFFNKTSHLKNTSAHLESSKEVVEVQMHARNLVEIFLDTAKWAKLFQTIVNEAKTVHVVDVMEHTRQTYARVIYEQLHILSPLVPPREFIVLRSCQQLEENLWLIADVSCDLPNVDFGTTPMCTKHPSGVLIQALPDGRSKVTWIEHVEVNEKVKPHRLYRDLLCGGLGYGARRWTVTLQRMCERLFLYSISDFQPNDYAGAVKTIQGRRSVMALGERMLKNFAWIMKMSEKLDFSKQAESSNGGVRISVRNNIEVGQPSGLIVCASSSLSLPVPPIRVYNLLRDLEIRHQWDVLCQGNPATEAARFVTGPNPTNNVNFLQPSSGGNNKDLMILQDGFIDALGGMVVYAPMDLKTAYLAISGEVDPSTISILPSGFIISCDGRPNTGEPEPDGGLMTLVTVAFQLLVSRPNCPTGLRMEESTTTVNTLVSSTIQRIKAMLNCE